MPVQSRPTKSSSTGPRGVGGGAGPSALPYLHTSADVSLSSALTPQQYLQRMSDLRQMDLQSAFDQMRTLLSPYPQRVYKMAYYRKQTKNHWARDDPAFCFVQVVMIIASSFAYGFAFRVASLSAIVGFVAKSVLIHWLGFGVVVASAGRVIANQHLMTAERSSSHVKQNVEWLYAFDVHCNAFVPLFVILCEFVLRQRKETLKTGGSRFRAILMVRLSLLFPHKLAKTSDGVQFFLLPLVLGTSLLSLGVSNTLFAVAFAWYFYITHLGYRGKGHSVCTPWGRLSPVAVLTQRFLFNMNVTPIAALPFLSHTEVFLFPIVAILAIYVFNFVGYPFGVGFNASRIIAYIYFEN